VQDTIIVVPPFPYSIAKEIDDVHVELVDAERDYNTTKANFEIANYNHNEHWHSPTPLMITSSSTFKPYNKATTKRPSLVFPYPSWPAG
jgi:hypothetical protein